ncbi:MAG: hypothetical protein ACI9CD_000095 [Candidatus Deianiraeaceae bacterium]|jgi:hypothetical protein
MNKTVVTSVAIITLGVSVVSLSLGLGYLYYLGKTLEIKANSGKTETRDRLTVCIDTVMSRAIEGNKPIEAENARHICG